MIPLPGGFQPRAAVALLTGGRARGRRAVRRRRAACTPRSTWPPHHVEQLVAEWGPGRARGQLCQVARARAARHRAADRRRRSHRADRLPLEDARSTRTPSCRASPTSCPSSTTTRSPAGRARPRSGRFSAVFLDDSDLHPRIRQRIELTRGLIEARRPLDLPGRERSARRATERLVSLVLLGDLRLALPGGAARRRPDAGR